MQRANYYTDGMVSPGSVHSYLAPPYLRGPWSTGGVSPFVLDPPPENAAWAEEQHEEEQKMDSAPPIPEEMTSPLPKKKKKWSVDRKEREYSLFTKLLAEFLGDVIFVYVGTMQGYIAQNVDSILHAAFSHGLTIFVLVSSIGHVSGGHFNPVVSWAAVLNGSLTWWHFPFFITAQILGGLVGSLLTVACLSNTELTQILAGATLLATEATWYQGLITETIVTFMLVHTILNCAMDTNKNKLAPLAIGLTLTIDILAAGHITGASMNPARSLGPNVIGYIFIDRSYILDGWWTNHYIYWAGPFLGATIASMLHWLFQSRTKRLIR